MKGSIMAEIRLTVEKYRKDSIIFIEGKTNTNYFYILKEGRTKASRENQIADDPSITAYKPGDTFGVVSCMGKRPRIETVTAQTDVSVIRIKHDQFVDLIRNNTPVAMKIIRSFSNKLRAFDMAIARVSLLKPVEEDIELIYNVAELYYKEGKYLQSYCAYKSFIKNNPHDERVRECQTKIKAIDDANPNLSIYSQASPLTREYKNGSLLFVEHEKGDEMFILQSGKVKIVKIVDDQEILLAVLNPGDIIGEMAILENKPRSASAEAYGNVVTMAINKSNFGVMVSNQPQLVMKIIQLLSERIWVAYRQLENVTIKDEYSRMLDALLIQVEKQRIPLESRREYVFDFGPDELLSMLGIMREKGTALIRRLLDDKNYSSQDGVLIVKDLSELGKQVDGMRIRNRRSLAND